MYYGVVVLLVAILMYFFYKIYIFITLSFFAENKLLTY